MKFADIPINTSQSAFQNVAPFSMSAEEISEISDDFLDYLQQHGVFIREADGGFVLASTDRDIKEWLEKVDYEIYSQLFDAFSKPVFDSFLDYLLTRLNQLLVLLSFEKPPPKYLLPQTLKIKVAEKLFVRFFD
jgi:hypothetical protein